MRKLPAPHPAPVQLDDPTVAAGRENARVRRIGPGLRALQILQEARAVEQQRAGDIDGFVELHRFGHKPLQPLFGQALGRFTHIGNRTKRHGTTGCCRQLYLSVAGRMCSEAGVEAASS